jgi:spore coat polysaccharide biosynthesis predicted glycosyltransferase SpsG
MLPVNAMVNKENTYSVVDIEDEKEDNKIKEKKVELIVIDNQVYGIMISIKVRHKINPCTLSTLYHTIETPPPNFL